ncbi:hypothetical protein [Roseovarius indicus]|uniref:Ferrochelatase n=1 Tax=Roseovarius indicus TaxID=540747 RepID=A0A5P3AF93_9RHOB|nr:hypothetical protein [Roseovarius indicus]QEW27393.1 hypothetical protein RIdsm_03209 [Roseovarius indicus]SFD49142.1 hypothetical protein SAMN04488031_101137 [Roseovarius indicus]
MKKTLAAAAIAATLVAGTASAGSLSDPIVTPDVVMVDAQENASNVEGLIAAVAVIAIILGPSL